VLAVYLMVGKKLAYSRHRHYIHWFDYLPLVVGTWRWTEVFCLVHWVSEILTPDIRVPLKFEYFLWLTDL
jgi:hypothetical protein